ncbi:MAG: YdeI/OmpD-associated family protein [Bacteroidales bacterium]|nr:YdeI/OmpD-associated family protein [Bacteroidales bacterium]MCF8403109.1 YdeI/OmpD-associated family protein [Bacteroidales bacterium]
MEITNPLFFTTRIEWRHWLKNNFKTKKEAWLVNAKKSSGKARIEYNDAVEEALCFGWIDSTVKSMDKDHSAQRYSPRRAKSTYSQSNRERLKWLMSKNKIHPSLVEEVTGILKEEFNFPGDIMMELKKDTIVWENYQKFPDPYKRIRIAYIDVARSRPGDFKKRLANFLKYTRENKLLSGYGGIDKHYFESATPHN